MVNDVRLIAHDLEALHSHDLWHQWWLRASRGTDTAICGSELGDTEETSLTNGSNDLGHFHPPHVRKCTEHRTTRLRHSHFRTPYIAGVKARTCFLSIGFVMVSATFWLVLM